MAQVEGQTSNGGGIKKVGKLYGISNFQMEFTGLFGGRIKTSFPPSQTCKIQSLSRIVVSINFYNPRDVSCNL